MWTHLWRDLAEQSIMEKVTLPRVVTWIEAEVNGDLRPEEVGVSTDSRSLIRGDVFFPLQGSHFDGHDFLAQAMEKGAAAVVVSKEWWLKHRPGPDGTYLVVDDPLRALQKLAAAYRAQFDLRVVGVTGTNGKTTTKEIMADVLARRYTTWRSPGNFNNHIGLPLSLLGLSSEHEAAVFELGMNHPGEIRKLARIARPDMGVITNVGPAHLEFMETVEEVAKAKLELLAELPPEGRAFLNADDPWLIRQEIIHKEQVVTFGIDQRAHYRASALKPMEGGTRFLVQGQELVLPILGRYNVYNALASVAVGREMGVEWREISDSLLRYHPLSWRMEIIEIDGVKVINDAYNANPASMMAAIETLRGMETRGRKVIILGDMWELGERSEVLHRKVGKAIAGTNVHQLITVGNRAKAIATGAVDGGFLASRVKSFEDVPESVDFLRRALVPGDLLLVKGSRGMRMERIIDELRRGLCCTICSTH